MSEYFNRTLEGLKDILDLTSMKCDEDMLIIGYVSPIINEVDQLRTEIKHLKDIVRSDQRGMGFDEVERCLHDAEQECVELRDESNSLK